MLITLRAERVKQVHNVTVLYVHYCYCAFGYVLIPTVGI